MGDSVFLSWAQGSSTGFIRGGNVHGLHGPHGDPLILGGQVGVPRSVERETQNMLPTGPQCGESSPVLTHVHPLHGSASSKIASTQSSSRTILSWSGGSTWSLVIPGLALVWPTPALVPAPILSAH